MHTIQGENSQVDHCFRSYTNPYHILRSDECHSVSLRTFYKALLSFIPPRHILLAPNAPQTPLVYQTRILTFILSSTDLSVELVNNLSEKELLEFPAFEVIF